jgi:hypothetical protein
MQFIENIISSLHASWYFMFLFTIIPMVVQIPRSASCIYLVAYAISAVWVVHCSIFERPRTVSLGARMDDRMRIFRGIGLQDL